jgi:hypothetical protein
MKRAKEIGLVGFSVALSALLGAGAARAGGPQVWLGEPAAMGDVGDVTQYSAGLGDTTGIFPGKLVCLRCNLGKKECDAGQYRHALVFNDVVYPLLVDSEALQKKINDPSLNNKNVKITGTYYPASGVILAVSVAPAD